MPHNTDGDREGIVIALLLDGKGGATQVGWDDIEKWNPEHGALWLQLDVTSPRAVAWFTSQGEGLATLDIDDRRPRFEVIDDHTIRMGVRPWLSTGRRDPGEEQVTNLWLQPSRGVVLSRGLPGELPEIHTRLSKGIGPRTIAALALEQLGGVAQRMTDAVANLEQPMADLEFAAASGPGNAEELRRLALRIVDLRRHLTPARVVVERLLAARPMWLITGVERRLSTIADDLRSDEVDLEHLLQRTGTVREVLAGRRATRMNETLYVLTIVSTIMLPLTFLTGLFGINVGIPGASYRGLSSTLAFLAVCAALTIIAWLEYRFLMHRDLLMRPPPSQRGDGAHSNH